jgi:hypothetical protein
MQPAITEEQNLCYREGNTVGVTEAKGKAGGLIEQNWSQPTMSLREW